MLLRTFGGLALTDATIRRPKPLLLLAYLALEGPQDRRFLAELFWLGAANPRQSLTVALGQLRAAADGAVARDGAQLRSQVECDAPALLAAATAGRWTEVLELYSGPFLAGVDVGGASIELEEWIYGTREELATRAQEAFVTAAEAIAADGDVPQATHLAGRAFELSVTGAEPDAETAGRLYRLLARGGSARARALAAEARTIGVDVHRSDEAPNSTASASRPTSPDLPTPLTSFVGRVEERRVVAALLASTSRLVTLVGLGGAGKTRLSLEVARELVDGGSIARACFVPLETVQAVSEVPGRILASLRPPSPAGDGWGALLTALNRRSVLLVLDNVEQIDGCARLLMELLEACPMVRILVTSREPLGVAPEHLVPVEGLGTPESGSDALERSSSVDAVDLFIERARRVQPRFELHPDNAEAVVRICQFLTGLPLALELAASLMRTLALEDLLSELSVDLDVLVGGGPDRPDRHASLRSVFDHTWQRTSPQQREALELVSVFEGGFTRRAAAEAMGVSLTTLASLVDASLVRRQERRFEVHPLIRQYTLERLAAPPNVEHEARTRHAMYWIDFVEARNPATNMHGQRAALAEVVGEVGNIGAAWRWLLASARHDLVERTLPAIASSLANAGRLSELVTMIDHALARVPVASTTHARLVAVKAHTTPPDAPEARVLAEHALALQERWGNQGDVAAAIFTLAVTTLRGGDIDGGRILHERALAAFRRLGNTTGIVSCLNNLAIMTEEPTEHRRLLEDAVEASRELDGANGSSQQTQNLGAFVAMTYGDYRRQAIWLEQATAEELAGGARGYILAGLATRHALALLRAGDADAADDRLTEAVRLLEGQDHWEVDRVQSTFAAVRALLHHHRGDRQAARAAIAGESDHPLALELRVRMALDERDIEQAERWLDALARGADRHEGVRDRLLVRAKAELLRAEIAAERGGDAATHILAAIDIVTGYCFVPAALDALVTTAVTVPTARSTALLRVAATHEGSTTLTRTRALASGSGDTATADGGALDWRAILDLTREVASELERTLQAGHASSR